MSLWQQAFTHWEMNEMRVEVLNGNVLWGPLPEPELSIAVCSQSNLAMLSCLGTGQVSLSQDPCVKVMILFFMSIHRGWRWKEKRAASCDHLCSFCTCSVAKFEWLSGTCSAKTLWVAVLGSIGSQSQPCTSCGAAAALGHVVCLPCDNAGCDLSAELWHPACSLQHQTMLVQCFPTLLSISKGFNLLMSFELED